MAKTATAARWVLLSFVAASLIYLVVDEVRAGAKKSSQGPEPSGTASSSPADPAVIFYYFHSWRRCALCLNLQETCRKALAEAFGPQLASGLLLWKVVNYEKPGNEHFLDEFKLSMGGPVLVEAGAGRQNRFKVLEEAWEYALRGDEAGLKQLIIAETKKFLAETLASRAQTTGRSTSSGSDHSRPQERRQQK